MIGQYERGQGRLKRLCIRFLAIATAVVAVLTFSVVSVGTASDPMPRRLDRNEYPIISRAKVQISGAFNTQAGSCSVGAVVVPSSIFSHITSQGYEVPGLGEPLRSAGRDHCPGTLFCGDCGVGSPASDIELVKVVPKVDNMLFRCGTSSHRDYCLANPRYIGPRRKPGFHAERRIDAAPLRVGSGACLAMLPVEFPRRSAGVLDAS